MRSRLAPPTDPLQKALVRQGEGAAFDLSRLSEAEQQEIVKQYQSGLIDIRHRADQMKVDVGALSALLREFSDAAAENSGNNTSVTITNTNDTSLGRTEIIVGNTARAQSGKLSRSQTGETDWTPFIIGGGAIALILIVLIIVAN